MNPDFIFLCALPITAFLYASVGHGGASGYLALMALFSFAPEEMRPTALVLNLFVSGVSFLNYYSVGVFKMRLFGVFAFTSIPAAFFGGMIDVDPTIYKYILGVLLVFAVLKLMGVFGRNNEQTEEPKILIALVVGVLIGFVSGLIGIGGGIILSPVILLLRWGTMKQAAAVSALFIWVNSFAGLSGQLVNGAHLHKDWIYFVILVLVGGFLGAYFGSRKMNNQGVKNLLIIVLLMASVKLLLL